VARDQKPLDLEGLVKTLRYVTTAVQVLPFIYTVLYIISLAVSFFAPDSVVWIVDTMFYASPVTAFSFLVLSRILRLCKWHRRACLLPIIPQVVSFVDYYIIELSEIVAQVNIAVFGSMGLLLLVAAYNVFLK
jgi:hypothetical protein